MSLSTNGGHWPLSLPPITPRDVESMQLADTAIVLTSGPTVTLAAARRPSPLTVSVTTVVPTQADLC